MAVKKIWILLLLCFSLSLGGCQIGTDDHQMTTLPAGSSVSEQQTTDPDKSGAGEQKEPAVFSTDETEDQQRTKDHKNSGKKKDTGRQKKKKTTSSEDAKKTTKKSPAVSKYPAEKKKNTSVSKAKKSKTKQDKTSQNNASRKKEVSKTKIPDVKKTSRPEKQQPAEQKKPGDKSGETEKTKDVQTCFISIECDVILKHLSDLKENKKAFVPSNGKILEKTEVAFEEKESVYDVLYRVCREKKIHLESKYTPAYSTYYVEGINQLYEFDCGNLSGWVYFVNGVKPNYGCSSYRVKQGDVILWSYTCNAGKDVTGK